MRTEAPARIEYVVSASTDRGRVRDINEDSIRVIRFQAGTSNPWDLHVAVAVADGMGGHVAGELASRMATELAAQVFTATPTSKSFQPPENLEPVLEETFQRINRAIRGMGVGEGFRPAGTTLLLACLRGDRFWLAHVGDSRAYLISPDDIVRLTSDHTWVAQQVQQGRMTGTEAEDSPLRNQLTQAIGIRENIEVETMSAGLGPGHALVLATDGLTEYVSPDEIRRAVLVEPPGAAERLTELANGRGGEDNISVAIIAHPSLVPRAQPNRKGASGAGRQTVPALAVEQIRSGVRRHRVRRGMRGLLIILGFLVVAAGVVIGLDQGAANWFSSSPLASTSPAESNQQSPPSTQRPAAATERARVILIAEPGPARFYVDDRYVGVGVRVSVTLDPGSRTVRAEKQGYSSVTAIRNLGAGANTDVLLRLEPLPQAPLELVLSSRVVEQGQSITAALKGASPGARITFYLRSPGINRPREFSKIADGAGTASIVLWESIGAPGVYEFWAVEQRSGSKDRSTKHTTATVSPRKIPGVGTPGTAPTVPRIRPLRSD